MKCSLVCCWGAGLGCGRWLIAAMLLTVLRPAAPETIRILCLNGLKHDYDLPNGLAAKVAAFRVNDDPLILPNDQLDLQLLDTTLVRTAATLNGVTTDDFTAMKISYFDSIVSAAEGTLAAEPGGNNTCTASRIAALVGPLYSSESVLLQTVLRKDADTHSRNLLTISYGATSPTLSNNVQHRNFGRTIPSDFKQGTGISDLVQHLDIHSVKLWGCNDVYCQGLVNVFIQSADSHKIQVDTEHSDFDFGSGYKAVKDIVAGIAKDCTAPRTQVLMVQRANAQNIFLAAKELGVESSLIFVGPVSVSGIAELPIGYLGFKTGVDTEATEFAKLQSGWNTELGDGRYPILFGTARDVSSHPYVGYAYDAVMTIAQALHVMRENGEDIYNTTALRSRLVSVTFRGSSGDIRFDQNVEPADGRYLIVNQKQSGLVPGRVGVWAAGTISNHDPSGQTVPGQTQTQWESMIKWPSVQGKTPTVQCSQDCAPGSIFSVQTALCEECPAGTYQIADTCVACSVGTHAPVRGLTRCLPCSSGYANTTGQIECTRCPANSETDLGIIGHICVYK